MRCPKCGNEVRPDEAFCGHCGTPNPASARAGEMPPTPSPHSGSTDSYPPPHQGPRPFPAAQYNQYRNGAQPSPMAPQAYSGPKRPATGNLPPLPAFPMAQPQQQSGFYQDATEAMTVLPNQGYAQPNGSGIASANGYPPQYSPPQVPPLQSGAYGAPTPSPYQQQLLGPGSSYPYGAHTQATPAPRKRSNGALTALVTICLIVTLLAVGGLAAFVFLKGQTRQPVVVLPTQSTSTGASATPAASATVASTPTMALSPTPTPGPTATPTLTTTTPTPDAGFAWCGQDCANNGFATEYPTGWGVSSTPGGNGLLFMPPSPSHISVTFKLPGQTTDSAQTILANDLQSFANQPGYTPPQGGPTASTIAGETWLSSTTTYQQSVGTDMIQERIFVYATVHLGRAYIIELQAPDAQYETVNNQYFVNMIGRFQFQPLPNQ